MSRAPYWLDPQALDFPNLELALDEPDGLLALGGDLAPERIVTAYRQGIFPWYEEPQPILWWSPDPRAVLLPGQLHLSRSLRKTINSGCFSASIDRQFHRVIAHCAGLREHREGTWISPAMKLAYNTLHQQGYAHSIEVLQDGELVGGLYGLALGKVFFGESMFSLRSNASKVALFVLARILQERGFHLIDCQVSSEHLQSMGARNMPRSRFVQILRRYAIAPDPMGAWQLPGYLCPLTTKS
jgi:leucyl/phenylalanyl-tRNA--protein transferase